MQQRARTRATHVPLDRLLYAVHDMSWQHVERWQRTAVDHRPPIHVEPLPEGWLFVHDGRHRCEVSLRRRGCDDRGAGGGMTVDRALWLALLVGGNIAVWWVVLHLVFDVVA